MAHRRLSVGLLCVVALGAIGCGTLIHRGQLQHVPVTSHPTGATVLVNGQAQGQTPQILELSRSRSYTVTLEKPGYQPVARELSSQFDPLTLGNIFTAGLGFIADAMSDNLHHLSPATIHETLEPATTVRR